MFEGRYAVGKGSTIKRAGAREVVHPSTMMTNRCPVSETRYCSFSSLIRSSRCTNVTDQYT